MRILTALDTFMLALFDAETGQRGYILTGQASYLQPYTLQPVHASPVP
jgi:CHASE3 domain sensor protein